MVGFSISVLSKGRIECLKTLFAALERECRLNVGIDTEVNVFDDSDEPERETVEQLCIRHGFHYYYFPGSISAKRNEATRRANYEVIWFVDSDCEPCEGVLQAYVRSYLDDATKGVLGVVEFSGRKPFFWKLIETGGFITTFSFAKFMDYAIWGPCANVCFRKRNLEAIGGFKEEFPFNYSGEDVDVGVRLYKAGLMLKCNPDAVVHHSTSTWLPVGPFLKKVFRWGRTDYFLMRDHLDMTYAEYPRFVCILFFVCLFVFLPYCSWGLPFLFLLLTPILFWTCLAVVGEKRPGSLVFNWFAFYMKQVYELGFVLECIGHGRFDFLFKKVLYGNRQLTYEIDDRNCLAIGTLLSFLFSFAIDFFLF